MRCPRRTGLLATALAVLLGHVLGHPSAAIAGDWPSILGPYRNGIAQGDETLADRWPQTGPRVVWQRPVGQGYAGVAVTDGSVFLFHREADNEVLERLDAKTGEQQWKRAFPVDYISTIAPDSGPRCVPLCHNDAVYVFGATGRLACVAQADGSVRWSRDVRREFSAPEGYFGCGSTPIVVADRLLVNVGGDNAGIVAFDLHSGKTLWQSSDERASYSSPVTTTWNSRPIAVFLARLKLLGVDPESGAVLFETPFGSRGPTVNGANPVVVDDSVLLTASYGVGAVRAKLAAGELTDVWRLDSGLSSQYTTPIVVDGVVYGLDGRQDLGQCRLIALDWNTGKNLWSRDNYGYATMLLADGKLVVLTTEGELVLVRATGSKYDELARARVFDSTARPLPALSEGKLYARDERVLKCLDLTGGDDRGFSTSKRSLQ